MHLKYTFLKYEPHNPNSEIEKREILLTNRLFIVSLTIYACTTILFMFPDQLGIPHSIHGTLLMILILIAFGINVAGLIKGITEYKRNREMAVNGIVGNLAFVLAILILFGIGIYYFYQFTNMDFTIHVPRRNV